MSNKSYFTQLIFAISIKSIYYEILITLRSLNALPEVWCPKKKKRYIYLLIWSGKLLNCAKNMWLIATDEQSQNSHLCTRSTNFTLQDQQLGDHSGACNSENKYINQQLKKHKVNWNTEAWGTAEN